MENDWKWHKCSKVDGVLFLLNLLLDFIQGPENRFSFFFFALIVKPPMKQKDNEKKKEKKERY